MAEDKFHLEIITPERVLVSDDIDSAELPGAEGEFQVLGGHTPFLTGLGIGPVVITKGVKKSFVSISGGYCEVLPFKTTILAQTAETADKIDRARAEAAKKRAEKRLEDAARDTSIDEDRARLALMRAINRLSITKIK
ncbi:F0F1 ATP synthase subunit epsilon [bacterium]|nr:F0F1 ATP synthase subunit epsilon [bacterium]